MTPRTMRAAAAALALVGLAACTPDAASGDADDAGGPTYAWPTEAELGVDDPSQLVGRVVDTTQGMRVVDGTLNMRVVPVQTVEQEGDETVVTLSSDILFEPSEATLPPSAEQKIGELVADVPDGATVQVHGHTDTVGSEADNQDLSERRAQAVADAIAASRDDLVLQVEGFGESDLAEPESGDDAAIAEARSANRRVEIRYGD